MKKREIVLKPEGKTCRRNPQLGPHKHRRIAGSLVCEGYHPTMKQPVPEVPLETKRYVPE